MPLIGYFALLLALLIAVASAVASAWGAHTQRSRLAASAEDSLLAVACLIILATAALLHLLLSRDFPVQYVYPLVVWLWIGGALLLLLMGMLVALWPARAGLVQGPNA